MIACWIIETRDSFDEIYVSGIEVFKINCYKLAVPHDSSYSFIITEVTTGRNFVEQKYAKVGVPSL